MRPEALARSDGDPLLGALLGGRFALLALRALGGRASVYDAVDEDAGPCVVKVVRCVGAASEAASSLAAEAEALRASPASVTPRCLGQGLEPLAADEPRFAAYLAMSAAAGADLASPSELAPEERALRAARALAVLHAAGVVHGDLKPAHVLVDATRLEATLIDLGAAVVAGRARPVAREATPAHAAPELERTGPTRAADVYALGSSLYRMVAGRPPFADASLDAPSRRREEDAPDPLPATVGARLRAAVSAALAWSPERRPADGAALARALEA